MDRLVAGKGGSLSKGDGSAWTFGLVSDAPASQRRQQQQQQQQLGPASPVSTLGKATAASPEFWRRSLTPPPRSNSTAPWTSGRSGSQQQRRTRSLERCFQQRIQPTPSLASTPSARPTPLLSRFRSRSLEKNHTLSTTAAADPTLAAARQTPLVPRRTQVTPQVLTTWCTFSQAFGGGKPRARRPSTPPSTPPPTPPLRSPSPEPAVALVSDPRDSPGSPVFEELFLPPPTRSAAGESNSNSSCCCCGGGPTAHADSCSRSASTPPPSPVPETVLYGHRQAPVLERHCVEGGEFIIAWLSHSKNPSPAKNARSVDETHRPICLARFPSFCGVARLLNRSIQVEIPLIGRSHLFRYLTLPFSYHVHLFIPSYSCEIPSFNGTLFLLSAPNDG